MLSEQGTARDIVFKSFLIKQHIRNNALIYFYTKNTSEILFFITYWDGDAL